MKRSFLARLQTNAIAYCIGALLLLLVVPGFQLLVLTPLGYGNALHAAGPGGHFASYLTWINLHAFYFILYRVLLAVSFALLLSLPFSLFRIIVAQELLEAQDEESEEDDEQAGDGLPSDAWKGKGFAIIAAWAGLFGIIIYIVGTLASTLYFTLVSKGMTPALALPAGFVALSAFFTITSNTVGIGLLALSTLLFGAMIARRGTRLWPGIWVAFSYLAIAVTALFSGSAVAIASAPTEGQAALTSPAILLFAVWVLWLGIMLIRLKPEE
ncbi:MAG TPA: hypothetical protein VHZ51_25285 [Ktedonobacteraceae bacterium]|jgi:hypothetical protein|nr:hypothetical protein [Ktedonobacteraceae bacterium]